MEESIIINGFEMTETQGRALIGLTNIGHPHGDLQTCIDFANAQEAAMLAEGPIQNIPADEGGR